MMEVKFKESYRQGEAQRSVSVEDYVADHLGHVNRSTDRADWREDAMIEEKIEGTTAVIGRLLEFLMEKDLMTEEEFFLVLGPRCRGHDLRVVK